MDSGGRRVVSIYSPLQAALAILLLTAHCSLQAQEQVNHGGVEKNYLRLYFGRQYSGWPQLQRTTGGTGQIRSDVMGGTCFGAEYARVDQDRFALAIGVERGFHWQVWKYALDPVDLSGITRQGFGEQRGGVGDLVWTASLGVWKECRIAKQLNLKVGGGFSTSMIPAQNLSQSQLETQTDSTSTLNFFIVLRTNRTEKLIPGAYGFAQIAWRLPNGNDLGLSMNFRSTFAYVTEGEWVFLPGTSLESKGTYRQRFMQIGIALSYGLNW
jgi:hypothetical protein